MKIFVILFLFANSHFCMPQTVFQPNEEANYQQHQLDISNFQTNQKIQNTKGLTSEQFGQLIALQNVQPTQLHNHDSHQKQLENAGFYQKPQAFNIDKFLNEFFSIGECKSMDIKNSCVQDAVFKNTFDHMSDLNNGINQFYKNFDEQIYQPLGLKKEPKESMHGIIEELLLAENEDSYIKEMDFPTNYGIFENIVMSMFKHIADASSDMENNKESVQQNLKKILESFHIYWNTLRGKNEIDRAVKDTKDLIRNILEEYGHREQYLFDLTLQIVQKIKSTYGQFMQAHQSLMMIQNYGPNLISDVIQKRYKTVCLGVQHNRFDSVNYVKEIKNIMDLTKGFLISVSHMQKKVAYEGGIKGQFDGKIIERIKDAYANFDAYKLDDKENKAVKQFTVIVLLKLKHLFYLMTQYYSIGSFVHRPQIDIEQQKKLTVKIYYVLMDMLVLVPQKCQYKTDLKQCVILEMNLGLRNITDKFFLRRSVTGWFIYETIVQLFSDFFLDADPVIWSSPHDFTTFYYQNLFSVIYSFKQTYNIHEDQALVDLESLFVNVVDNFQKEIINVNFNTGLLRQLQNDIYTNFLTLKAKYDEYSPIMQDTEIIKQIENFVISFLKEFEQEYNSKIDDNFYNLLASLKKVLEHWSMVCLSQQKRPRIKVPAPLQNKFHLRQFPKMQFKDLTNIDTQQIQNYANQNYFDLKAFQDMQKEMGEDKEHYESIKSRQNKTKIPLNFQQESTEEELENKLNKAFDKRKQQDQPPQQNQTPKAQPVEVKKEPEEQPVQDNKEEVQEPVQDNKEEVQESVQDSKEQNQDVQTQTQANEVQDISEEGDETPSNKKSSQNQTEAEKQSTQQPASVQNNESHQDNSQENHSDHQEERSQQSQHSQSQSRQQSAQDDGEIHNSQDQNEHDLETSNQKQVRESTEEEREELSQDPNDDDDLSLEKKKKKKARKLPSDENKKEDEDNVTKFDVLTGNRYDLKDKLQEALQTVPNFSPSEIKSATQTNDEDSGTLNGFTLDPTYGPIMR